MPKIYQLALFVIMHIVVILANENACELFNRQFWKFQNKIRTNPRDFIPFLEDWIDRFTYRDDDVYRTVQGKLMRKNEGTSAIRELINFLKDQEALHPLQWSDPLAKAADRHASTQGPTGRTGHTGADGSSMKERIED